MFSFSQKDNLFFDMFADTAKISCKAAEALQELMTNYTDVKGKVTSIEEIEHECDRQVHKILKQLNRSFVTPIDREDINVIAKELDNITDSIESTAHRFNMFNVTEMRDDALKLVKLIVLCTKELVVVMEELKSMKRSSELKTKIIEINRIENEGDEIFRSAITNLFVVEKDALEVIKWKEIFEYLENTLDVCEDVANIVEGVVMKHA